MTIVNWLLIQAFQNAIFIQEQFWLIVHVKIRSEFYCFLTFTIIKNCTISWWKLTLFKTIIYERDYEITSARSISFLIHCRQQNSCWSFSFLVLFYLVPKDTIWYAILFWTCSDISILFSSFKQNNIKELHEST